jgi:hypothetical protein
MDFEKFIADLAAQKAYRTRPAEKRDAIPNVTKLLKPSDNWGTARVCRTATRVNADQALKRTMRRPT